MEDKKLTVGLGPYSGWQTAALIMGRSAQIICNHWDISLFCILHILHFSPAASRGDFRLYLVGNYPRTADVVIKFETGHIFILALYE